MNFLDIDSLISFYNFDLNQEEKGYLEYHAQRIGYFVNTSMKYTKLLMEKKTNIKILDIGPHFLTSALYQQYQNLKGNITLNTLGWKSCLAPSDIVNHHFQFDLNNVQHQDKWLPPETHDLIIMCEVVEHLYTAPELVLSFIKTFLSPGGYLIFTTPNAAFLPNRVLLSMGKNPFEMIRTNYTNPGHFREYTVNELKNICQKAGLKYQTIEYHNFAEKKGIAHSLVRLLGSIHPPFKKYISVVCQN